MPEPASSTRRARLILTVAALVGLAAGRPAAADTDADVRQLVDRELPGLVVYYKALHAAPELSHQEAQTATQLAAELKAAGYAVTEHLGKYLTAGLKGYGIVGVLRNGPGPTLLIRTELDALPVAEKTNLPYASTRRAKNDAGAEVPVMHACGHDVHVTALIGVARVMARLRDRWSGTLELVGQPAEEMIDGAQAMLRDGLYERVPRPDLALALHDTPAIPAGTVGLTPGFALAASTQMDIIVRGVGGHGSAPEAAKDPVVLAANIIVQLQTIVAREISPFDQAVVTVGTIHGGTKRNIIPDEVKLELNIRTYKEDVRQHVIQAVARIARAAALGAGMPEERLPLVSVLENELAPPLYNDPALVARLRPVFQRVLGEANVRESPAVMASEDFGNFGLERSIPVMMFGVGMVSAEALEDSKRTGVPLPGNHSPLFAPIAEPTIRTGIVAMSAAALEVLKK
jgi:amidohydrolase